MNTNQNTQVANAIEEYLVHHGKYALQMHVWRTGRAETPSERLPFFQTIDGFPVMVKDNDETTVTLIKLPTGEVFTAPLLEYNNKCGTNLWMLDEALVIMNPVEYRKQSDWVRRAHAICGIELSVSTAG